MKAHRAAPLEGLRGACWVCARVCEGLVACMGVKDYATLIHETRKCPQNQNKCHRTESQANPKISSGNIRTLISVISLSSNPSVPCTNYSCYQLNVFIPFCLLYYSTFIHLFSPHLFTRIKAYSDRIIPLHNKNKSQRLHTHHSHSKSTTKL